MRNHNKISLFFIFLFLKIWAININNLNKYKNNGYNCCSKNFLYNQIYCLNTNNFIDNNSKTYEYCRECLKKKQSKDCKYCTSNMIFNGFIIFSPEDTLNEIIYNNKSIARFGDGEFQIIFGKRIGFQKANKKLSNRLKTVFQSNEEGLLIGIPDIINLEILEGNFNDFAKNHYENWIEKNKLNLMMLIDKNKKYYSTLFTRYYIDYLEHIGIDEYIKKLKKIWDQKDVIIIEGEKSRLGIGNNLFDNMKSIKRIICPSTNAFNLYDKILNAALKMDKRNLILLALGPTATILAYDLYKAGYHVVDVGHIDIEYEWYLKNATTKIKIKNKYVNEVKDGGKDIKNIEDKNYYNQIIEKILQ